MTKLDALKQAISILRAAGFEVSAATMFGERDHTIVIVKADGITLTRQKDGQMKIGIAEVTK